MNRREFLGKVGALGAVALGAGGASAQDAVAVDEKPLADLLAGIQSGKWTSEALCTAYLKRIKELDPKIGSVIELNPEALDAARKIDRGAKTGALAGLPILLKDNIDTADKMMTTAGSLALVGPAPAKDAWVAAKLREAGAVLLGKANLSEWANIRSSKSTSGWSARGGQTRNPYFLDRNPCGSSSGSAAAVSASLCAAAIGTETDGSIMCPSQTNGIVGLKPTVGLISRAGIVPISHSQDTAGPMTRTVRDAAILLGAMAGIDKNDPATAACKAEADYTKFLDKDGLKGMRLGVPRKLFMRRGSAAQEVIAIFEEALKVLASLGAVIVDPADIPNQEQLGRHEMEVLLTEFKADLAAYLSKRDLKVKTLADVIEWNDANKDKELAHFDQELFRLAEKKGTLESEGYRKAVEAARKLSRDEGIDRAMTEHKLDAFVAPTGGPAWKTDYAAGDRFLLGSSKCAAVAGYPSVTVPSGNVRGLPVGLSFFGRAWSEGALLRMAYAFEQKAAARIVPKLQESWGG